MPPKRLMLRGARVCAHPLALAFAFVLRRSRPRSPRRSRSCSPFGAHDRAHRTRRSRPCSPFGVHGRAHRRVPTPPRLLDACDVLAFSVATAPRSDAHLAVHTSALLDARLSTLPAMIRLSTLHRGARLSALTSALVTPRVSTSIFRRPHPRSSRRSTLRSRSMSPSCMRAPHPRTSSPISMRPNGLELILRCSRTARAHLSMRPKLSSASPSRPGLSFDMPDPLRHRARYRAHLAALPAAIASHARRCAFVGRIHGRVSFRSRDRVCAMRFALACSRPARPRSTTPFGALARVHVARSPPRSPAHFCAGARSGQPRFHVSIPRRSISVLTSDPHLAMRRTRSPPVRMCVSSFDDPHLRHVPSAHSPRARDRDPHVSQRSHRNHPAFRRSAPRSLGRSASRRITFACIHCRHLSTPTIDAPPTCDRTNRNRSYVSRRRRAENGTRARLSTPTSTDPAAHVQSRSRTFSRTSQKQTAI